MERSAPAFGARCDSSNGRFAGFEHDLGQGLISAKALAASPVFARARAVARFEDGPARRLGHRLKYSDRALLARPIAR
jgi:hypothetical protein